MEERLLFDTHCHLDDDRFTEDRVQVISALPGQGIFACLTCGSDLTSSQASRYLADAYAHVYFAAGIHPHEAAKAQEGDLAAVKQLLQHPKALAVGEIGLDYHYDFSPKDVQQTWLLRQLDLAYELGKPVLLHVRESHGMMIETLRANKGKLPTGIMHCFSGSAETAMEYQRLGMYISFAGSLTFKNAARLREAALAVDLDRLLIETDSPYLSPVPHRGQRNDPGKVGIVCQLLAELHGQSFEEIARRTRSNACRLFGLEEPA